jgi:two-component system, cell cycle sensor histidine kinase and response regulator CckA
MSRVADLLRRKEQRLTDSLNARLRETAFENRYSLHPRRLAELGAEQARAFLDSLEAPRHTGAFAYGQKLAREGIGEKTILLVASDIQRFCRTELGSDIELLNPGLDAADEFSSGLLDGFMKAREEQILTDQEQLRRALSTALQSQGEELLIKNHAINTSINGILLADLDGKVTWVNASFLQMWGSASAEEVIGAPIGDFWVGEDVRDIVRVLPRTGGWHGELSARRKDGTVFSVELSASLIRNEEGGAIGLMTSIVDITEGKHLQAQILQAQKMDAMGQLAGGIAHDFNNLLTAITGYSDLLLEDLGPGDAKRADLEEIKAATLRATALTRQLLAFSRKQVFQSRVLDLNEVVQTLEKMLRRLIGEDVKLGLSLAPTLGAIRADPGQIEQVILNLAVNSRDAMPNGGSLTIETANVVLDAAYAREHAGAVPGRYVRLAVSDTGIGMDAETRSHIFEPFFTTKELGKGTGLGLSTVYGIVKQSGGYVWVYSEPGRGTTFKVYLPQVDERPEKVGLVAPAPPVAGGRETVLVAEDDPAVRAIVAEVLTQKGYRVLRAPDDQAALALARGHPEEISLLVTDIVMPGMTGRELAELLTVERPDVRVLYMSGYTDDAVVRHGVLTEGMPYLQKPFNPRALATKVREVLDRK